MHNGHSGERDMRRAVWVAAIGVLAVLAGAPAWAVPSGLAAALADPHRTDADRALDASRKPLELLTFAGVKPGQTVVDVFPGPYFDRLFGDVVGPRGKVVMFIPTEAVAVHDAPAVPDGSTPMTDLPNVTTLTAPINSFSAPEPADASGSGRTITICTTSSWVRPMSRRSTPRCSRP
jgi:predicted methyltransferase